MLKHEYGHTIQLRLKGNASYIFEVTIPSMLINALDRMDKLPYNYYTYPFEAEANRYGGSNNTDNSRPQLPVNGYKSVLDLIILFWS